MMRIFSVLLAGVTAIFLTISTLHAAGNLMEMSPGTKVSGLATFAKKQIALPAGEWEVVFAEPGRPWKTGDNRQIKIGNVLLVQKSEDDTVQGFLFARMNLNHHPGGWARPKWLCDRKNVHHAESDKNRNIRNADCWMVNHHIFKRSKNAWWTKVFEYTKATAGSSSTYVGNWYWRNDSPRFLNIGHFINPAAYGFPALSERNWTESVWHRDYMPPEYQAFVDAVKAFGEKYREAVRAGFRKKLEAVDPGLEFVYPG